MRASDSICGLLCMKKMREENDLTDPPSTHVNSLKF
jgi:hypothetical protein